VVRVLEHDPELGLRVPASSITRARTELVAEVRSLDRGVWELPAEPEDPSRLGLLILEGLLAREVVLAGTKCTELLGQGDLVQPSAGEREERLVHYRVHWHVLDAVHFAVLSESIALWPQVASALLERALRRTRRMSVHQALLQLSPVETRLHVLFWFLAERWGRVTPGGISLRLRLSHQLLGQMVGSQRASVTTALRRIAASGLVVRRTDGTWLLRGSPPGHLEQIHWAHPEIGAWEDMARTTNGGPNGGRGSGIGNWPGQLERRSGHAADAPHLAL
jgi:CRP-like cAMP-binding protein